MINKIRQRISSKLCGDLRLFSIRFGSENMAEAAAMMMASERPYHQRDRCKEQNVYNNLFDKNTYRTITHELGHYRGVTSLSTWWSSE